MLMGVAMKISLREISAGRSNTAAHLLFLKLEVSTRISSFSLWEEMNFSLHSRRFNSLLPFVGKKKRTESMLQDNATIYKYR